jgi:hypothetical protein
LLDEQTSRIRRLACRPAGVPDLMREGEAAFKFSSRSFANNFTSGQRIKSGIVLYCAQDLQDHLHTCFGIEDRHFELLWRID